MLLPGTSWVAADAPAGAQAPISVAAIAATPSSARSALTGVLTANERRRVIESALRLDRGLQHLVGGGDRLRVRFVRALRGDRVDDLRDDRDVAGLEVAALQRSGAVEAGLRERRRAGRAGLREEVLALRREPGGVREAHELDLPELLRLLLAGDLRGDGAVGADLHRGRVLRDRDLRAQEVAVGGDDRAVRVALERAVARVRRAAVRHRDLEEPVALDRDVERVAGLLQRPLGERLLRGADLHAQTDVLSDRDDRRADRRAGRAHGLVDQVLESRLVRAEPGRVDVREVVADRVDVVLLSDHPGRGGVQCSHHDGARSYALLRPTVCTACATASSWVWIDFWLASNQRCIEIRSTIERTTSALLFSSEPCSAVVFVAARAPAPA